MREANRSVGRDAERGSVTIVSAGLLVLALALSLFVADLARVLVASAQGQSAADSAALAAAQELALSGVRDPADVATEYAARNGASLVTCSCQEGAFQATADGHPNLHGALAISRRHTSTMNSLTFSYPRPEFALSSLSAPSEVTRVANTTFAFPTSSERYCSARWRSSPCA